MDTSSLDGANLRFGHHTVSLRAQFTPDGAAPAISNSTALAGPNQVTISAVLVPEGTSPPGYPYQHIAEATFTPDQDDISNSTRTNSQQPRSGEVLIGMQRDAPTLGNKGQRSPRQFAATAASAPWFGAPAASDASSNTEAPAPTPRRSVRSTQANFSGATPQPHLDNSRDAIDATVLAPGASPGFAVFSQAADRHAAISRPGPWHDLQLPKDLTQVDTGYRILAPRSSSTPTQLMSEAQRPPGKTGEISAALGQEGAAVLPSGSTVRDPYSATGRMLSPVADLSPVAIAGRQTGQTYRTLLRSPTGSGGALPFLAVTTLSNVGQGGAFDYQRQGNHRTGFTQLPQYRDVSNFNVGLFCQQAGLSLDETLTAAGRFAGIFSGNAKPDQPYGLDQQTAEFIKVGYKVGRSGVFDSAPRQ